MCAGMLAIWRYFETEYPQKSPHCGPPTLPDKRRLRIVNRRPGAPRGMNSDAWHDIHGTIVIGLWHGSQFRLDRSRSMALQTSPGLANLSHAGQNGDSHRRWHLRFS